MNGAINSFFDDILGAFRRRDNGLASDGHFYLSENIRLIDDGTGKLVAQFFVAGVWGKDIVLGDPSL